MITTPRPLSALLALGVALALGVSQARAVSDLSYTLFQTGYAGGATIIGSFTGADLDGNGILVHFPREGPPSSLAHLELTSLSIHFSGNSLSSAFDLSLEDLYGFVYDIGTNGIGDDPAYDPGLGQNLTEGIGAFSENHFYASGLGPTNMIGAYVAGAIDFEDLNNLEDLALDSTDNLLLVTPVPEPGSGALALATAVFAAVFGRGRNRDRWRSTNLL